MFSNSGFIRCICAVTIGLASVISHGAAAALPGGGIGIVIHDVAYWAPVQPFVNVFNQSGAWLSQKPGVSVWDDKRPLDIGPKGWIRSLKPDQQAAKVIMSGKHYPAGDYHVYYEGSGTIQFALGAGVKKRLDHELLVHVNTNSVVLMKILSTDPNDPIRNIRMLLPGFDDSPNTPIINPAYVGYLNGFSVIRFLGWANSNATDLEHWSDRPIPGTSTQANKSGVALEYMIDLARDVGAAPWFNVPYKADNDYIRHMAVFLKEHLGPNTKFYLEYSNEVWNGAFPQGRYAAEQAQKLGMKTSDEFYVKRTLQTFKIFEDVFGGSDRFVRVLAGQAVNLWRTEQILKYPAIGKLVDAYAIAPYFGLTLPSNDEIKKLTTEQILDRTEKGIEKSKKIIHGQHDLAAAVGLPLITYEAGQGLPARVLQKEICAPANRDPRMGELYKKYIRMWNQETDGNLLVLLSDVSAYAQYGCWGLSEYVGQPLDEAPKLRAVREMMAEERCRSSGDKTVCNLAQ